MTTADVEHWFGRNRAEHQVCLIPAVSDFIEDHCADRYMVTLTDRRKLNASALSREVRWALHKTNEAFFGTNYKRRRTVFLATYTVQETTYKDGLHAHLIVGVPKGALLLKPNRPSVGVGEYLVQTWTRAARQHRSGKAQDWRPTTNLAGAFGYLQKTIRTAAHFENVDVGNTIFPQAYAVPPRAE